MDKTLTINSKELALSRLRDAGGYIERELETLADPDFVQTLGEGLLKAEGAEALGTAYANSLRERLTELRQIIGDTPDASIDHIPGSILEELEENVNFLPFSASDNAKRNEWTKDQLERIRILRGCFEALVPSQYKPGASLMRELLKDARVVILNLLDKSGAYQQSGATSTLKRIEDVLYLAPIKAKFDFEDSSANLRALAEEFTVKAGCSKACYGKVDCVVGWPDGSCGALPQGTARPPLSESDAKSRVTEEAETEEKIPLSVPDNVSRIALASALFTEIRNGVNGLKILTFTNSSPEKILKSVGRLEKLVDELCEDYAHAQVRERRYERQLENVIASLWRGLNMNGVTQSQSAYMYFLLRLAKGKVEIKPAAMEAEIAAALAYEHQGLDNSPIGLGGYQPIPGYASPEEIRAASVGRMIEADSSDAMIALALALLDEIQTGAVREGDKDRRLSGAEIDKRFAGLRNTVKDLGLDLDELREAARTSQFMASLEHERAQEVIRENNTLRRKANLVRDVSRVLQRLETFIAGSHPDALRVFFGNVGYAELLELKASIIRIVEGSKDEGGQIKPLRFDIPPPTKEAELDDAMPRTWLQDKINEFIEPDPRTFEEGLRYGHTVGKTERQLGFLRFMAEAMKPRETADSGQYLFQRCPDFSHVHTPDGRIEPFTGQKINGTLHAGASKAKNTGAWFDRLDAYLRQAPYDVRNPGYVSPLNALAALELLRKAFKEEAEGRDILKGELDRAKKEYVKDRQELDARLVTLNERHRESLDRAEGERVAVNTALLASVMLNRRMGHTTRAVDKTLRVIEKAITKLLDGKIWEWRTDYTGLSEGDSALRLSAEIKALVISAAEACEGELDLYEMLTPEILLMPEGIADEAEVDTGLTL